MSKRKKEQTVFEHYETDYITGEVTKHKSIKKVTRTTQEFLLAYVEAIGKLAGCSGSQLKVVLACLRYVDYNTNELLLNPNRRDQIRELTGLKKDTVNTAISKLYKKNIFIREKKTSYLNPNLFYKGRDLERDTWFRLHLDYKILDDTDLDRTGHSGLYNWDFSKVKPASSLTIV